MSSDLDEPVEFWLGGDRVCPLSSSSSAVLGGERNGALLLMVRVRALLKLWLGVPHNFVRRQDHMGLFAEVLHADATLPCKPQGEIRLLDLLEPMKDVRSLCPKNQWAERRCACCKTVSLLRR